MTNPSPAYAAGRGEAVAWIAFNEAQRIDEVRVVVSDERWRPLLELNEPLQAEWSSTASQVLPAAWATRLSDAQQRAVSESMRQSAERGSSNAIHTDAVLASTRRMMGPARTVFHFMIDLEDRTVRTSE
jgi:hypothetical protein